MDRESQFNLDPKAKFGFTEQTNYSVKERHEKLFNNWGGKGDGKRINKMTRFEITKRERQGLPISKHY